MGTNRWTDSEICTSSLVHAGSCWFTWTLVYWPHGCSVLPNPASSGGRPLGGSGIWVDAHHREWGFKVPNTSLADKRTCTNHWIGSLCSSFVPRHVISFLVCSSNGTSISNCTPSPQPQLHIFVSNCTIKISSEKQQNKRCNLGRFWERESQDEWVNCRCNELGGAVKVGNSYLETKQICSRAPNFVILSYQV